MFSTPDCSKSFYISALHDRRSELTFEQLAESDEQGSVYAPWNSHKDERSATFKRRLGFEKYTRAIIILGDFYTWSERVGNG